MAQIAWTSEALRWLRDIYDYIAADNPDAAERVAFAIYESVRVLQEHPRLGQRYDYVTGREVRILHYSHILGVFHGALPIERYLV